MASPIATHGFTVQAQPGINYLDPRMMVANYGDLVPAASRGAALGTQFAQIQEEAQMRPLRRQLAQIQVDNAVAMAPLEQQYKLAQIAEAQQNAAVPRIVVGDAIIEAAPVNPYDMPAIDEEGNRTGKIPLTDLIQIQNEDVYGPGGVKTTRQVRKTLKTGAQREIEENAANSLAELRAAQADAATLRAQNDAIKAEAARVQADAARTRADLLQNNPLIGYVDVKRADGRTYRQYFQKSDPTKIVHEVDRGELGGDIINFGGLTVSPGVGASVSPRASAQGVDPDIAELAGLVTPRGSVTVGAVAPADNFKAGQTYTDASGNRATYLGNGQWRQVQ